MRVCNLVFQSATCAPGKVATWAGGAVKGFIVEVPRGQLVRVYNFVL